MESYRVYGKVVRYSHPVIMELYYIAWSKGHFPLRYCFILLMYWLFYEIFLHIKPEMLDSLVVKWPEVYINISSN